MDVSLVSPPLAGGSVRERDHIGRAVGPIALGGRALGRYGPTRGPGGCDGSGQERRERNAPDMLIARSKAVASLPVADPLGRNVDKRLHQVRVVASSAAVARRHWPGCRRERLRVGRRRQRCVPASANNVFVCSCSLAPPEFRGFFELSLIVFMLSRGTLQLRASQVAALLALNIMLDTILVVVAKSDALRELRMFSPSLADGRKTLLRVAGFPRTLHTQHHRALQLASIFSVILANPRMPARTLLSWRHIGVDQSRAGVEQDYSLA